MNTRLGIGTTSPSQQLHIANTGTASAWIAGDTDNITESDTAYLKITQDGALVGGILGTVGISGQDPEGTTFTGTFGNALLLGTNFANTIFQLGTNNVVGLTMDISQNIGIGNNLPTYYIDVIKSPTATSGDFRVMNILSTLDTATSTTTSASLRGIFVTSQTGLTATGFTGNLIGMQFLALHYAQLGTNVNLSSMIGMLGQALVGNPLGVGSTSTATAMRGAQLQVVNRSAKTGAVVTDMISSYSLAQQVGPGVITNMINYQSIFSHLNGGSGAGTTTNMRTLHQTFSSYTGGTVTNAAGVYLEKFPTAVTYTNTPFMLWAQGNNAINWLEGNTMIGADTADTAPTAVAPKLHVNQGSTTAAISPLLITQDDVSEQMFSMTTTIGTGNAIEAVGSKTLTVTHYVKVTITGVGDRYFAVGTIA